MIDGTPLLRTLFEKWLQTQAIFIQRLSTKMRTTAEIHGVRCGVRPSAHDGSNSQVRKPDGTDAIHFHRARCSVLPTPSIVPGLCGPGAVETTRCPLPMPQPAATDIYARALSTSSTLSEELGGVAFRFQDPPQRRGTGKMRSPIKPVVFGSRAFLSNHPEPIFIFRRNILKAETFNPERSTPCHSQLSP
jgi:hypothetical protein